MSTLRTALREYLANDAPLMAILTGGIMDASLLPPDGGGVGSMPLDTDGVSMLPFGVIRFRGTNQKEIVSNTERRFVEIYFYQEQGYEMIEQAKHRVKDILHRKQVTADDAGIAMFHWTQDVGEFPAPEFGNVAGDMSRYYVDYVRR